MKALLLNSSYQPISYISAERKALKLWCKDKVDILSEWDSTIGVGRMNSMRLPAVVRMRYYVRWILRKMR